MFDYEKIYLHLMAKTCDAIEELEKLNIGKSRKILIDAQIECEKMYSENDEEE